MWDNANQFVAEGDYRRAVNAYFASHRNHIDLFWTYRKDEKTGGGRPKARVVSVVPRDNIAR